MKSTLLGKESTSPVKVVNYSQRESQQNPYENAVQHFNNSTIGVFERCKKSTNKILIILYIIYIIYNIINIKLTLIVVLFNFQIVEMLKC